MPMNIITGSSGNRNLSTASSIPSSGTSSKSEYTSGIQQQQSAPSAPSYVPETQNSPDLEYIPPSLSDIAAKITSMIKSYLENKIKSGEFTLLQLSAMGSRRLIIGGEVVLSFLNPEVYSILDKDVYDIGLLPGMDIMSVSQDIYDKFVTMFPDFQDDQILILIYNKLTSIAASIPVSSVPLEEQDEDDVGTGFQYNSGGIVSQSKSEYPSYNNGAGYNKPASKSFNNNLMIGLGIGALALILLLKK